MRGLAAQVARAAGIVALCTPAASRAQELGLDLSAEQAPEARPSAAFLGFGELAGTEAEVLKRPGLESRLSAAILEGLRLGAAFSRVVDPDSSRAALGEEPVALTLGAPTADRLDETASGLAVDRLLVALWSVGESGRTLTLRTHDRWTQAEEIAVISCERRRDSEILGALRLALQNLSPKLSEKLARVQVVSSVEEATVTFGPQALPKEPREAALSAGDYALAVTAPGYLTHEQRVTLAPGEFKRIEVQLERPPLELAVATEAPRPTIDLSSPRLPERSLWKTPGPYVAIGGGAVAAAGVVLGLAAKGVEGRAKDNDGDGALDVTRSEMRGAVTNAALSNLLVAAGAALIVGGATWAILQVAHGEPSPTGSSSPQDPEASDRGQP